MRYVVLLLTLLATPAVAQDACYDVWFTRNLHFDRAGYCFGSPLGQAVFDNSDCIGTSVTLPPSAKRQVDQIKSLESYHGCKVDTSRVWIDIPDIAIRWQLNDLPVRDEFESGCLGWLGGVTPLRAGHDDAAAVIGRIDPGDYILFSFMQEDGWSYVTTHTHDFATLKSGGWVLGAYFSEEACAAWAG